MDGGTEVGRGERLDGAGEVSECDAPIDDQTLDLVEDGKMAGVGGVAAVGPPRRHDEDRRWLGLHHPYLDRRGVGPQHSRPWRPEAEEERVPHAARRMARREVERLEV